MTDPLLDYANDLPVELDPVDITRYKTGNTGIDYLHTFDSGEPGPHVLISTLVHGNELCGAIAADWLLHQKVKPIAGQLSIGFMNVAAYLSYDPEHPNRSRWVDEDFNRLWGPGVLDDPDRKATSEVRRAREVRPFLDNVDLLLDIHSMQQPCIPLMMAGMVTKGLDLAAKVGLPATVVTDKGHKEGMRMRDYNAFRDPDSPRNALLIECGQHWEATSAEMAKAVVVRFLQAAGIMAPNFGGETLKSYPSPHGQNFYRVDEIVTIKTNNFVFSQQWTGFEHLAKGTLIGHDGPRAIIAPFEPTILIMPTRRLYPGKTAVRLAQPITPSD